MFDPEQLLGQVSMRARPPAGPGLGDAPRAEIGRSLGAAA